MRTFLGSAAGALALTVLAATAAVAEDRVPITDPSVLESMGFARDATNVYRLAGGGMLAPEDFGGIDHFLTLPAKSWQARVNSTGGQFAYNGGGGSNTSMARLGAESFYDAPVSLPSGALLKDVKFYGIDTDAANEMAFFLFEVCVPENGGVETATTIADGITAGNAGPQAVTVLVTPNRTVNNVTCAYTLRVRSDSATGVLVIQKARLRWARQVSPAPGAATFPNDVPTTHPFFRFIEAFASAGITGGCGAGSFCPDTAVTRAQMATFISVALGLTFQ